MTRRFQVALLVLVAALAGCGRPPKPDAEPPVHDPGRSHSGPPLIQWSYPPVGAVVQRERIPVIAAVRDDARITAIAVTVNGERLSAVRSPERPERVVEIETVAPLLPGDNVLAITATNTAGQRSQVVRRIRRVAADAATPPKPGPWAAERYAVVIGIDVHDDPKIPRLRFTRNDADAVYALLATTAGFKRDNVLLLTSASAMQPTLANMKRALGEWLVNRAGKDDLVIVYYAGHGAPEVDATGRERSGFSKYLVPRDADSASLYVTAFPMGEVETIFRRLESERVVMFFDCAFSGSTGGRTFQRQLTRSGHVTREFLDRLGRNKGRVVISASGPHQLALELPELGHGLFTHHLLQGLAGAADTDRDGIVTVNEIFAYVHQRVTAHARQLKGEQTPVISGAVGDLPLVRIRD